MTKNKPTFSEVLKSLVRPTTKEYDQKLPTIFKRTLGHLIIFPFVVLGIVIMFLQPLSILTCRHIETKQTDCQLQERIAWVIPVRKTPIPHLKEAYVNQALITGEDEDGNKYSYYTYDVILVSASGEIALAGTDKMDLSATLTVQRINGYLNTPTTESLTIWGHGLWQHTLVTLAGGVFFILFAFLFITTIVNTVLLFGAWIVEFVLLIVGWLLDRVGLSPDLKDRVTRFRRALRSIAIPPSN